MGGANSAYLMSHCAETGDVEGVKKLVEQGVDLEIIYEKNRTPLLKCFHSPLITQNARLAMALYLVSVGANPNAADHRGWTPLHYAASRGDEAAVRFLLENGAKVWVRDSYGRIPSSMTNLSPEGLACRNMLKAAEKKEARPFPYALEVPAVVPSGDTLKVKFTSTLDHSPNDYIQIYYAVPGGWYMTPRMGSYRYVPEVMSGEVEIPIKGIDEEFPMRVIYFLGETQKPVIASQQFDVRDAKRLSQLKEGSAADRTSKDDPKLVAERLQAHKGESKEIFSIVPTHDIQGERTLGEVNPGDEGGESSPAVQTPQKEGQERSAPDANQVANKESLEPPRGEQKETQKEAQKEEQKEQPVEEKEPQKEEEKETEKAEEREPQKAPEPKEEAAPPSPAAIETGKSGPSNVSSPTVATPGLEEEDAI